MNKNRNFNIFWDMDGTLFEFIYGGDIYSKGYFENLGSNKNIVKAAERIDGMTMANGITLKSYVLSNYLTDSPHNPKEEKNIALDREVNLPKERRLFLPCGSSKWDAIERLGLATNAILVDDYGVNTSNWRGPYIKVSKDAEDMRCEMQKHSYCISPDLEPAAIVNTICYAVENMIFI